MTAANRDDGRQSAAKICGTLVAFGLVAAIVLQLVRERAYPVVGSPVDEVYFSRGSDVGKLALSFKSVLADVYWIRAIQYFAATRLQHQPIRGKDLLYPLLEVTTSLDPQFNIAYRFGAIFLSQGSDTATAQPAQAIALLDKGFAQNPTKWQYLYDKAFVYYWALLDYRSAAHWFSEAAKVPRSPEWMPGLAGYMLASGGDRQSSRFLFTQILETAEHEYMRDTARWRLGQLDVLDAFDQLNPLLDRYAQVTGTRPTSWTPLIERGWLRAVPTDPNGVPFLIDAAGHASIDRQSKFYPLPIEPATAHAPGTEPSPRPGTGPGA